TFNGRTWFPAQTSTVGDVFDLSTRNLHPLLLSPLASCLLSAQFLNISCGVNEMSADHFEQLRSEDVSDV
ncbi:MAG: hypothetical protein ACP5MJ_06315, partial [Roseiflexus sp.]